MSAAIDAGYRNIDIDSSTLVDLSRPTVDTQQRDNYVRAAELTALSGRSRSTGSPSAWVARSARSGHRTRPSRSFAPTSMATGANSTSCRVRSGSPRSVSRPVRRMAGSRCRVGASPRSSSTSSPPGARCRRPRVRPRRRGPARCIDPARRVVPSLPGGRDRRDPPGHRLPERPLRAPGVPGRDAPTDRGVVLRQRRRRTQGRPDGSAVRLHGAQEGDRTIQA